MAKNERLNTTITAPDVLKKLDKIREWYPALKYMNNSKLLEYIFDDYYRKHEKKNQVVVTDENGSSEQNSM